MATLLVRQLEEAEEPPVERLEKALAELPVERPVAQPETTAALVHLLLAVITVEQQ